MRPVLNLVFLFVCSAGFSQQPIYATIAGGDLYSIDLQNCTREFIGSTGYGFGDIAMTGDGRLWGIINWVLYEINPETAEATLAGGLGEFTSNNLVALNDSILLGEQQLNLYALNVNTLTSTLIGYVGYGAAGDLTWYDDDLYIVSPLIRIELNDDYTAIENVTEVNYSLITCEGAVTVPMPDDNNAIIGFNGPNAIRICHLDGTYEMLCPDINFGGTPGAATLRLPNQTPEPAMCTMVGMEDDSVGEDFTIFPNPTNGYLTIQQATLRYTKYRIYNGMGQLVRSGVLGSVIQELDIPELANGLYSLELTGQAKTRLSRLMVEK